MKNAKNLCLWALCLCFAVISAAGCQIMDGAGEKLEGEEAENISIPPEPPTLRHGAIAFEESDFAPPATAAAHAMGPAVHPMAAHVTGFPSIPNKPTPKVEDLDSNCGPLGKKGDPDLNRLKNREDEASSYISVTFDQFMALQWPTTVQKQGVHAKLRSTWTAAERAAIGRYEGTPISVEGYLAGCKIEDTGSGESCNCNETTPDKVDYHIWLTKTPPSHLLGTERRFAIVVEATPRVRLHLNKSWTKSALDAVANAKQKVRISGWVFFDPEHPEQLPIYNHSNSTRGTLWEIHPIMKIEVFDGSHWNAL